MVFVTLVTGSSSNHFKSLCNLLNSIFSSQDSNHMQIIVYDLGLENEEVTYIKHMFPKCLLKILIYESLPTYFNISINAGEYAWKPLIIKTIWNEFKFKYLIWLDAGCLWNNNLTEWTKILDSEYIYSPISAGYIHDWCSKWTIKKTTYQGNDRMRSGGVIGLLKDYQPNNKLIHRWYRWATSKEYIAPFGSNRNNHRQDQSLLSILISIWKQQNLYHTLTDNLICKIHQDVE